MPPVVAALHHRAILAGAFHHQHLLQAGDAAAGEGGIHRWFKAHRLVFAVAPIGGDYRLGLAVDQAITQCICGKATKDHRMGGADACTGQHGNGGLGYHWHVQRHQIAFANAQGLERIGGFTYFPM